MAVIIDHKDDNKDLRVGFLRLYMREKAVELLATIGLASQRCESCINDTAAVEELRDIASRRRESPASHRLFAEVHLGPRR